MQQKYNSMASNLTKGIKERKKCIKSILRGGTNGDNKTSLLNIKMILEFIQNTHSFKEWNK